MLIFSKSDFSIMNLFFEYLTVKSLCILLLFSDARMIYLLKALFGIHPKDLGKMKVKFSFAGLSAIIIEVRMPLLKGQLISKCPFGVFKSTK